MNKEGLKKFLHQAWGVLSHDLGWKIASVVFAIMLWSYVISANPSITRDVTLTGVDVIVSGQSVLESRELALLTDPNAALNDVRVRVAVPQSSYSRVTPDSVRVELDLTRIRQTGKQTVTLSGMTSYGKVVQITPSTIELEVEKRDQRYIPVNVEFTGELDGKYWYSNSRTNPSQITVSGPSSVVREVSSALASVDVTGVTATVSRAEPFVLLNSQGEVITQPLSRSTTSVTVGVDVYPTMVLPVNTDVETATTGMLPDGYRISRIEVQPEQITVAADQTLLDGLGSLSIVPVDVTGAKKSFSTVAAISSIKDIKNLSSGQVNVTVYIEEVQVIEWLGDVDINVRGLGNGMIARLSTPTAEIKATGAYSAIARLADQTVTARVDVSGLEEGTYNLAIQVETENLEGVTFECVPENVRVVLSKD